MNTKSNLPITIAISTRNRGIKITGAIQSILRSNYPNYVLRIVDQSENDQTESAVKPFLDDARIHYTRARGKGISAGCNLAINGAQTDLVAITDDDCEVSVDWLSQLRAAFAIDARIGVVFGNVLAGPCDPKLGFIMAYVRKDSYLAKSISEKHKVEGISASMGIRQSVWKSLGGFDEMLGSGALFRSAGETDFAVRTLLAGHYIYETPKASVVHYGFKSWDQSSDLFRDYLFGIGAMLAKNFKCRHYWSIGRILVHLGLRWAVREPVVEFGFRPPRGLRLKAFIRGMCAGALSPVNRKTGHFIKPEQLHSLRI